MGVGDGGRDRGAAATVEQEAVKVGAVTDFDIVGDTSRILRDVELQKVELKDGLVVQGRHRDDSGAIDVGRVVVGPVGAGIGSGGGRDILAGGRRLTEL